MSGFKGTKGDWIAEESYSIEFNQPIININVVEIIEGLATIWSGSNKITEESKANAQLIAHAPQMLEMLKEITAEYEFEKGEAYSPTIAKALELIQQATTIK